MFCSICQDEIMDKYIHTQCCKQDFHKPCLLNWLIRSSMCPLCRLYLDPKEIADDPNNLPVYTDQAFWWYKDNQLHREDGPAYVDDKGNKEWYYKGRLHREDGPACIYVDGCKQWWFHGLLHREDGPAIDSDDGHREWWVRGWRHRADGPAVIHSDGRQEIWINGANKHPNHTTLFGMLFSMLK